MYVPKWLVQVLLGAAALCLGWMVNDAFGGVASGSSSTDADQSPSTDHDELVAALSALSDQQPEPAATPPTEITIVLGDAGAPAVTMSLGGSSPTGGQIPQQTGFDHASGTQLRGTTGTGSSGTPSRIVVRGTAAAFPSAPDRSTSAAWPASGASGGGSAWTAPPAASGGITIMLSPENATTAIGEHIVIAYDDSIVLVGDDAHLVANTGDAQQGAVVALDAQDSSFATNPDPLGPSSAPHGSAAMLAAARSGAAPPGGAATLATDGALMAQAAGGYVPNAPPGVVSPLISPIISFSDGRAVDIAGYEDHSLSVRGLRNVVTYDDSNVFIDRDGKINANTGDTDSAGLNAVDTVRSTVTAGPHCDDGCDDESIIQAQAGVFDEGDVAIDGNGNVVWAPDGGDGDSDADEGDDSLPGDNGDDEDAEDDESDDGDVSDPVEPPESRDEADSGVDPTSPPSGNSLVIGGDGYDDLGVRVDGQNQVVTYDDSNVVMGGTGDVNAQIGDSDTGGTVTMGTVDSTVSGGNSR